MNLWVYGFIIVGGLLQAMGSAMNGQLYKSLGNPWMASFVSFGLIAAFFFGMSAIQPRPLPAVEGIRAMPWWAPVGGLVGAVAVYAGLMFVQKVGAGTYTALSVTAALIMSIVLDHFGLLRLEQHTASPLRVVGGLLMIGGVILINRY